MNLNALEEISRNISRTQYRDLVKVKKLFQFKYPKLLVLVILTLIAYKVFSNPFVQDQINAIGTLGYVGIFIAGMLFSFGFTTPFSIGFFLVINPENIILTSLIAGIGALVSDIIIFKTIKFSFMSEFKRLEKTKPVRVLNKAVNRRIGLKIRNYFLYIFAGIVIASPLPDEIGVSMLAGLTEINPKIFALLSFIFNSVGILVILLLGTAT